jgi:flagellar basal-body rod protein FlgC
MSFFGAMDISASGLSAQRLRMDVISENMANINTTRTSAGGPYKRKVAVFSERPFSARLDEENRRLAESAPTRKGYGGVKVQEIAEDNSPGPSAYDPGHPDANADGYVAMPNVSIVEEMVDMISASRAYEANVTAILNTKAMIAKTMEFAR